MGSVESSPLPVARTICCVQSVAASHEPHHAESQKGNADDKADGSQVKCTDKEKNWPGDKKQASKYDSLRRSLSHALLVSSTRLFDDLNRLPAGHALFLEQSDEIVNLHEARFDIVAHTTPNEVVAFSQIGSESATSRANARFWIEADVAVGAFDEHGDVSVRSNHGWG
jgi:hypothetical protein